MDPSRDHATGLSDVSKEGLVQVVRPRNGEALLAELKYGDAATILYIDGDARGAGETGGYLLSEASAAERAELRRWGYELGPTDLVTLP
jgi:hypothetical protein